MTGKRQAKKDGVDDSDEETAAPVQIKPKRPHKRKYIVITRDLEGSTGCMDLKISGMLHVWHILRMQKGYLVPK